MCREKKEMENTDYLPCRELDCRISPALKATVP